MAKDKFDVCFSVLDQQHKVTIKSTRHFANSAAGFKLFDAWLSKLVNANIPLMFAMEATGVYYEQLAWKLHLDGRHVSVVLPNKAKRYAQALGIKSKNDSIDAKALARMAAEQLLERWHPISENIYSLRVLTRQLESFQNIKTQLKCQLHAFKHSRYQSKFATKMLKSQIKNFDKSLKQLKKQILELVSQDPVLETKLEKITAIKGVGLLSALTVIAETDGFALIKNQRQLVSYAGYDVVENQSGKRAGKTRISKKGNAHIRRIMHLPAFNVVRYEEPVFKALYDRLIEKGKTKMQAYVAVQKKLLVLIYTLWKRDEAYQPGKGVDQVEQPEKETSGNEEPRLLSSVGCAADIKKVAPHKAGATQDGLPENESPEVLSSVLRS